MSSQGQKAPIRVKRSRSNSTSGIQSSPSIDPSTPIANFSTLGPNQSQGADSISAPAQSDRNWFGLARSRSHSRSNNFGQGILPTHSHSSNPQVDWVGNHRDQDVRIGAELELAEDAYEAERNERTAPLTPGGGADGIAERSSRNEYTSNRGGNTRTSVVEMVAKGDRIAREEKERKSKSPPHLEGGMGMRKIISTGLIDRSDSMPSSRTDNNPNLVSNSAKRSISGAKPPPRATDGHISKLNRLSEDHSATCLPRPQPPLSQPALSTDHRSSDYFSHNSVDATGQEGNPTPHSPMTSHQPTASISPGRAPVVTPGGRKDEEKSGWFGNALKKTMSSTNVFSLSRKPSNLSDSKIGGVGNDEEEEAGRIQRQREQQQREEDERHHAEDVVDYLDVVDPEVAALGHLSNIQNSIFMPNISNYFDRRPSHSLPSMAPSNSVRKAREKTSDEAPSALGFGLGGGGGGETTGSWGRNSRRSDRESSASGDGEGIELSNRTRRGSRPSLLSRVSSAVSFRTAQPQAESRPESKLEREADQDQNDDDDGDDDDDDEDEDEYRNLSKEERLQKKKQELENSRHIQHWQDLDDEERNQLDEHVRALLTKKAKFRRGLKGFWAFVKTPMGFIMTLYGFLITFWGTAIVLFIFNWIDAGSRRRYWIEICDQILCALFAAVGLGFAPFRAVDTYRMIHIAHFHHLTWERRKKLALPELRDPNDLPRPINQGMNQVIQEENQDDVEAEERIRKRLERRKLGTSQSFQDAEVRKRSKESGKNSEDTFSRSNTSTSQLNGTVDVTPASNNSRLTDPLNQAPSFDSSDLNSASGLFNVSDEAGLQDSSSDSDGDEDATGSNSKSNKKGNKGKRSHRHKHHKNLVVPPSAREDAIRAAELDRVQKEEKERKEKEKAAAKEAKAKAKLQARLQRGSEDNESSPNATESEEEGEEQELEESEMNLRPPIKRHTSIQSELVKDIEDVVVLTPEEQSILQHHQRKFHASHTFYRFHETSTHKAFPLDLMIVIVCLLDCHSLLQAALGGCTWGIYYLDRPTALTATLISCSLSCNAVAGLLIYLGGRRTKKTEEVERRLKVALEAEAWKRMERRRQRELEERERELEEGQHISHEKSKPRNSKSGKKVKVKPKPQLQEKEKENPWKTT